MFVNINKMFILHTGKKNIIKNSDKKPDKMPDKMPDKLLDESNQDYNITTNDILEISSTVIEYNNFFNKYNEKLKKFIIFLIESKDKLKISTTIGKKKYNMVKSKKILDKGTEQDIFVKNCNNTILDSYFYNFDLESKKNFNDRTTEFITNNYLVDKNKYLHFILSSINLLLDLINEIPIIKQNIEINFIMKGGNLLKLLFDKITKDFNSLINDYLHVEFGKNFSNSDFDFDFNFKPKNNIELDVYNECRVLVSNIINLYLIILRDIIVENKEYFFNFFNLNKTAQDKQLKKLLDIYNKSLKQITINNNNHDLKDASIISIYYDYNNDTKEYISYTIPSEKSSYLKFIKNDINIINDTNTEDRYSNIDIVHKSNIYIINHWNYIKRLGIDITPLKSINPMTNNIIYNTSNLNIYYHDAKFSLFRIKINFIIEAKLTNGKKRFMQVPGELLDICLAKRNDNRMLKSKPEFYTDITIKNINKNLTIQSHVGLINDLEYILFIETSGKPWIDHKYEKRLTRLIILIILRLLYVNNNVEFKEKIIICDLIFQNINKDFNYNILSQFNNQQLDIFNDNFKILYKNIKSVCDNHLLTKEYKIFKSKLCNLLYKMINVLKIHRNVSLKQGNIDKLTYLDGF
jgi:hypothetical protein